MSDSSNNASRPTVTRHHVTEITSNLTEKVRICAENLQLLHGARPPLASSSSEGVEQITVIRNQTH